MKPETNPTLVREAALIAGVCARPVISRVTDLASGETQLVPIACGATREDRCPTCAERARRLRIQQCREGWHLDSEPEHRDADDEESGPEDDGQTEEPDDDERRVRSTRRRQDAPDLPRVPMDDRTIGRAFTAPDGKTYRPSMFLTLTLPSYGRVTSAGVPADPSSYNYRRAARDAMHFPKLVDRFWQNLRRCAGYQVQYFAAIEAQRRLAPHLHAAVRGTIPRKVIREVRAATYHQVWWPPHDEATYTDRLPVWTDRFGYVDPDTGAALPTWDEALDALDANPEATPAHVMRFGPQDDMQGLLGGTPGSDRAVGYLCKYLTKSIASTHDGDDDPASARESHIDRLAEEVRWLPCAPNCSNWLRYGVQPKNARAGMVPGHCKGKAHDRAHLGLGGRRVLVSRKWSGKTLAEHKADRAAVVRAALDEAGIDPDDHDELSVSGTDGQWSWEVIPRSRVDDRTYAAAIASAIVTRQRWRSEYETAKAARAGPSVPDRERPGSEVECKSEVEDEGDRCSNAHRPDARLEQKGHGHEGRLCRVADGDIDDVSEAWASGAVHARPGVSAEGAHEGHEDADGGGDTAEVGDALKDLAHRSSASPSLEPAHVERLDDSPSERGYAAHPVSPGRAALGGIRSTRRVRQFGSSASE